MKRIAMTGFGETPFFTASEPQGMGYRMVIWPVSIVPEGADTVLPAGVDRAG